VIQEQYGMNTTIKKKLLNYLTEKLTFKSGTGDAPDDWYVVYADKKTNLLETAYIVTLKAGKEEAEKIRMQFNI
jgi:hypothetical protein